MVLRLPIGTLKNVWVGVGTEIRTQYLPAYLADDIATAQMGPVYLLYLIQLDFNVHIQSKLL